jgi:hypothetical protein
MLNEGTITNSTMESEGRNSNVFVKVREDMMIVTGHLVLSDNRPHFKASQSMDLCHNDGIVTCHNRPHNIKGF